MKKFSNTLLISLIFAGTPLLANNGSRNPFQFEIAPKAPPAVESATSKTESIPKKPQEPVFSWQIQGIFQTETGNTAILNQRFVSVGDVIRGWTVHEIQPNKIILKNKTETVQVRF